MEEIGNKIFFHPTTLTLQSDMRVFVTTTKSNSDNNHQIERWQSNDP